MENRKPRVERRRHPRSSGNMAVMKFRRLNMLPSGQPDVYHGGNVVNISRCGMYFATDHSIMRGEEIEYYINLPNGKTGQGGMGRVVRVNRDPDRFFVAIEFIP